MTNPTQILRSSVVDNRPTGKQPGEPYVNYADMQFGVVDTSNTARDLLTVTFFSATGHYDIGEFVFQAGNIYRAIAGNGPGAFNPTNWSRLVTVSDGDGLFLPVAGGTMTGPIVLAADPSAPMQAVTKQYSDLKAPLASPVFTGDPQAPTPAPGDNDTSIATTAFVNVALGNSGVVVSDTAPVAPPQGKMWFDSVSAQLYVRYDDGNSAQWVVAVNNSPDLSKYLPLSGGAMTGNLSLPQLNVVGAAGTSRGIWGLSGASSRWTIELGNTAAESGGNAGSNFVIDRYNDAGVYVDAPFSIARSNGSAYFTNMVTFAARCSFGNGLDITGGLYIASGGISIQAGGLGVNGDVTANNNMNVSGQLVVSGPIYGFGALINTRSTGSDAVFNCQDSGGTNRGSLIWQATTGNFILYNSVGGAQAWCDQGGSWRVNGATAYKPGGGSWTAPSDVRIKNILGDYTPGLAEVIQLRPVNYTYKANDTLIADVNEAIRAEGVPKSTVKVAPYPASPHYNAAVAAREFVGLVAQEVEEVFPGMVTQEAGFIDGEPVADLRNLDTTPLIFALVNAVKELKAEIEALKAGAI